MKTTRTLGIRSFSGLLAAAVLFTTCIMPASAAGVIGNGVEATYDEAYYATTDYYGNLTEGSVVKSYIMNGAASLTDYGDYDEVVNLTDGTVPSTIGGCTTFDFTSSDAPSHFYFEGKTAAPFEALPWKLSMHYTLNGVPTKAEELAGKTGVVEIFFDAVPNKTAAEYARNNYTLEAMAIFNQDDILSLEAEGAQIQLIGNLRAVLFVILPGEEQHFSIRVGSNDFSFGGMTFLMVPATLAQLSEISKLAGHKDDIEENYRKLSDSLDTLLDSVSGISGSLYSTADGLDQLNRARGTVSDGKETLYGDTDTVRGDLSSLSALLTPIADRAAKLSQLVTDSKKTVGSMTDAVTDLEGALENLEDALEDMDDKRSITEIRSSLITMQNALNNLKGAMTALNASSTASGSTDSYEAQLNKVLSLHDIYTIADFPTFLTKMLELSGKAPDAASAAAMASQLITGILPLTEAQAADIGQTENWKTVQAMKSLSDDKAALSFEQFCTQILTSPGMKAKEAAEAAKTMNQIWTIYSGSDDEGIRDRATLELLLKNLDTVSKTVDQSSAALLTPTANLLSATAALCGNLEELLKVIDSNDLIGSAKTATQSAQTILDKVDDLHKLLDAYEPTLQESLKNLQNASTASAKTVNDLETLIDDAESLLRSAGSDLDAGTKKTLEGLAASLRATARSLGTTGNVKSAKNNISGIVEDVWNEYTGEANNLLLIDANAAPQSLTDSRNPSPTSIQVLIRTQEIKEAEPPAEEIEIQKTAETTFFQRVAQMFKDFWAAITGIFR